MIKKYCLHPSRQAVTKSTRKSTVGIRRPGRHGFHPGIGAVEIMSAGRAWGILQRSERRPSAAEAPPVPMHFPFHKIGAEGEMPRIAPNQTVRIPVRIDRRARRSSRLPVHPSPNMMARSTVPRNRTT
jgi:hypothetical protein